MQRETGRLVILEGIQYGNVEKSEIYMGIVDILGGLEKQDVNGEVMGEELGKSRLELYYE